LCPLMKQGFVPLPPLSYPLIEPDSVFPNDILIAISIQIPYGDTLFCQSQP